MYLNILVYTVYAVLVTRSCLSLRMIMEFSSLKPMTGQGFNDMFSNSLDEVKSRKLNVMGNLPVWLNGTLIRNGPAWFESSKRKYDHIFDGLAKLHSFRIASGGVEFSSRFLRSSWYNEIITCGNDIPPSITTGPVYPPFNIFQKLQAAATSSTLFDNVPVNIHKLGGNSWVAVTDAPVMLEFDPETLETKGRKMYANSIVGIGGVELFSTAHPHSRTDGDKAYTYNYFLELRPLDTNIAHMVQIDKDGHREIVGSVELGKGVIPYVHDFSMTENYIVLAIYPVRIDMAEMMTSDRGFLRELKFKDDEKTKFYVFDLKKKSSKPIATFHAPPVFAYHHINAYEEEGRIICDITGYATARIANGDNGFAYVTKVTSVVNRKLQEKDGSWYRFELPLYTQTFGPVNVEPTILASIAADGKTYGSELVRINEKFKSKPYRYSYGFTGFAGDGESSGGFEEWAVVKLDHAKAEAWHSIPSEMRTKSCAPVCIWRSDNCYPSECVFVARQEGKDEDDGVLLSQVYDGNRRESFLLILDARNLCELARCYTGTRIPISFHGQFVT